MDNNKIYFDAAGEFFSIAIACYLYGHKKGVCGEDANVSHVLGYENSGLSDRIYEMFSLLDGGLEEKMRKLTYTYFNNEPGRWIRLNDAIDTLQETIREYESADNIYDVEGMVEGIIERILSV